MVAWAGGDGNGDVSGVLDGSPAQAIQALSRRMAIEQTTEKRMVRPVSFDPRTSDSGIYLR
jgi:hypothetical protein